VSRTAGRQRISPSDFPIKIDAIRINNPYINAGNNRTGLINQPEINEIKVAATVKGGAKYL
jgi:hypothetical protein